MHDYRKLKIWERSKDLSIEVYKLTSNLPIEERFSLTSQIRRASVSVPSNIAEGCGRKTNKDFKQFLNIALGSTNELLTQFEIVKGLGMLEEKVIFEIMDKYSELRRMIYGFYLKL